jgi:hypothetical protein
MRQQGNTMVVTTRQIPDQPAGNYYFLTKNITLPRNQRYFVGAWVRPQVGASVQLQLANFHIPDNAALAAVRQRELLWLPPGEDPTLHTGPVASLSERVFASAQWKLIGVSFFARRPMAANQVDQSNITLQVLPTGDGQGQVELRDFVVYRISPSGTYVRVKVLDAGPDLVVAYQAKRESAKHSYDTGLNVGLVGANGVTLPRLKWSSWITFDDRYLLDTRFTLTLEFKDATSGDDANNLNVQFQVATAANHAAVYFDRTRNTGDHRANLVLPEGNHPILEFFSVASFLEERINGELVPVQQAGIQATASPKHFWFNTALRGSFELQGIKLSDLPNVLSICQRLGLNALTFSLGQTATELAQAAARGLEGAIYYFEWFNDTGLPLDSATGQMQYDLAALALKLESDVKELEQEGQGAALRALAARGQNEGVITLKDEPAGLPLGGALYTAAFHQYLQDNGLDPQSFGFGPTDWHLLQPLHGMTYAQHTIRRPSTHGGNAARLWYWQLRFWNTATARVFRTAKEVALTNPLWGAPRPVMSNLGTAWALGFLSYPRGTELLTMAREGAVTMLFSEDHLNTMGWRISGLQLESLLADLYGAAARDQKLQLGTHIVPNLQEPTSRILSWIARGATHFDFYSYGPFDTMVGNAFAGRGQKSLEEFRNIAQTSSFIAKAEPALFGADRRRMPIAMLFPQSESIWNFSAGSQSITDERIHGIYFALTHGHYPVDFVFEEQLPEGILQQYQALYVETKNLSRAAWTALQSWVEAGGVLILGPDAAERDELNGPVAARNQWLGVSLGAWQKTKGGRQVIVGGETINIGEDWRPLTVQGSYTTVATYGNGNPAVIRLSRGQGTVYFSSIPLGPRYLSQLVRGPLLYQTGYHKYVRQLILEPLRFAGLDNSRPVWTDDPLVELARLRRQGGGESLIVLNFNNQGKAALELFIPGNVDCVYSVVQGRTYSVGRQFNGTPGGVVTIPLGSYDVLAWDQAGRCPKI